MPKGCLGFRDLELAKSMSVRKIENQIDNKEWRDPLLVHLQMVEHLIKEMNLPEDEEERRLNKLIKLEKKLFSQPANSKAEAEIIRQIDKLLTTPTEVDKSTKQEKAKPEADEILAEFQQAYRAIFRHYSSVGEALDKMEELKRLKQKFFSCAAGSEEEKEIREEIRKIIRGESFGLRLE